MVCSICISRILASMKCWIFGLIVMIFYLQPSVKQKCVFNFTGEYAGFDENEPTSQSGGKAEVIRRLKEEKGFKTVVHIGDGATDLEACPPANAFIGMYAR